ncbi:MAG: MBL fold metallo-hydrolase [Actinomycetota bacterium]|jgi:glyoxylase-like metal-dependent hydrolase (beta-lactamase superfamily II)|nr:MBL fold metallo-hydrolase [Actinomycetota bacterium]
MTMYLDVTAEIVARELGKDEAPFLLDVREPEEVAAWAIPGIVNIPLGQLQDRLDEIPRDRQVVAVCASGNRSGVAASVLAGIGFDTANLVGGMQAWGHLYDTATVEVPGGLVVQVRRRGKGCLSYVVGSGGEAAVVDPSVDVDRYFDVAAAHGWRITRVFDTHLHADHLSGARELAELAGASLHLNPADTFEFPYRPLADGELFTLDGGAELSVATLHTPGHTLGSTVYLVSGAVLLSGDTLFVDGVGRPDLAERAEEFARNLHRSLAERVLTLDDDVLVLPAHYGEQVPVRWDEPVGAPVGHLRSSLPPLALDESAFVTWAVARATDRPPHYQQIITANMGRTSFPSAALAYLEEGPNRCSA